MSTVFRALLHLYPRRHRQVLGAEMQAVFEQRAHEQRLLGLAAYLRFVLVELAELVLHAVAAQFANMLHDGYLESQMPFRPECSPSGDLPEEVLQAQNRVAVNLNRLLFAIAHHRFAEARYYSNEESKAREHLRQMREKYGIGDAI